MHEVQKHILRLFNHHENLSTSQIIQYVYQEAYKDIMDILKDDLASQQQKNEAHAKKSKLHRRMLHHINTLVSQHRITIVDTGAKGEKKYGIIKLDTQTHSPSLNPALPLEGYESRNIVFRYRPDTWMTKMNAFLLHAQKCASPQKFHEYVQLLFGVTNDVIIVNDMETLIQNSKTEEIMETCIKLEAEAKNFDQHICFIFDLTNISDENPILTFLHTIVPLGAQNFSYIFDTTGREMMHHSSFVEKAIQLFSRYRIKFNIKNDELHQAPMGLGRAGTYTFDEQAWRDFCKKRYKEAPPIMACGQASVIVDVKKCFDEYNSAQSFLKLIDQVSRSLFIASTTQRRQAAQYFSQLYAQDLFDELFTLQSTVIRLWNYDFESYHIDRTTIQDLIKQANQRIKDFAHTQETIYLSCGMPIQFKIGLACAYRKFNKEELVLFEAFDKLELKNINDIYTKKLRETLLFKEQIGSLFGYGDEMRFYRKGNIDPIDVVREFQAILHTYKFPFFCYKFTDTAQHTVTLHNFLE